MSANTHPYIIELAGKPVAIADTISRAAAAALYAKSLEISARVASASDVLALRTLPVLAAGINRDVPPQHAPIAAVREGLASGEHLTSPPTPNSLPHAPMTA